jgi:MFS family permease
VAPNIADPVPGVAVASARGRWILVVVVLGSGIAGIDSAAMNVALGVIGRDLSADFTQLQWTVTGYTLSLAALVLLSGALGDRYGRWPVFLTGVAWFAGASVLCAIASGIDALISARSLQGVGGPSCFPLASRSSSRALGPRTGPGRWGSGPGSRALPR